MNTTKTGTKPILIACFVLSILLVSTAQTCVAEVSTTVSIADVAIEPDSTITLPIVLSGIQNYGTGKISITYNPSVVHVAGVTSSSDSIVSAKNINNVAGIASISAWNTDGVSGDIVFANVTFTTVGTDSTPLNLDVDKLVNTSLKTIPVTINNGSIAVETLQPPTPFVIVGYVYDPNGDPCNDPWVRVTNVNTGVSWDADNSTTSNYYRLVLDSDDVNAGEILRFDATDGTSTNSTDHTMTDDEVNVGGLFDFNLMLESSVDPAPYLVVYTISNTVISPNGDGIKDDTEIDVEFSESVEAAIRIENATGIVKVLYTSSSVMNPNPKTWDGTDNSGNTVSTGMYRVNVTMYDGVNPVVYNNTRSIEVTCADTTPPTSITDLQNTTYEETHINWTWTDPDDADFSHVMVYLDGTLATTVTKGVQCYSAAGLNPDTEHVIGTRTVDQSGNVNETWVNRTAWTKPSPVVPAIVSIGSAEGSVGDSVDVSINITNASSIGAMDIRVAYNASILHATNVANGSLIESLPAPLVAYHLGYMDINISFVTFPETIDGDGELFIATFDLIGGEAGDSSTLEIAAEAYRGSVPIVEVPVTAVNGVITVTGVPDTTPPVITDVANETPTSSSVAIIWTTDEASKSLVRYGTESGDYTDEAFDATMTTSHTVQLSGLTPNTTYYFAVNSTDASGNTNESGEYSFTTMVMTEVGVAIDCATMGSDPSCRTTVDITLNGIADYGAGTIYLYYNESVVNLVAFGLGDSMRVISNSSSGLVKISASNTDGLSGDVVFANVTFKPTGLTRGFSKLNLTVETLYDRNYTALQTVISNCSISIGESNLPEVTAPDASPSVILNDTAQMRPRKPGTNITNLTVHVTDDTGVGSVYINLTPILGAGHDIVQMIGPDGQPYGDWHIVTNASYSSLTPYSLNVMAKDYHGNWENGTRITLEVRRRGDVRSSSMAADNKVDSGDYFYIARYTVGLDPAPDDLTAQIVTADSWDGIDMADALYIAMYEAYKPPYGDYEAP